MDVLTFIGTLYNALKTYQQLENFLLGGEMAALLQKLGGIHMKAASTALADKRHSQVPNREVESAITCLRVAHEAFRSHEDKYRAAASIAICYRYLQDQGLTHRYLTICNGHFEEYIRIETFYAKSSRGLIPDAPTVMPGRLLWGIISPIGPVLEKIERKKHSHRSFMVRCSKFEVDR